MARSTTALVLAALLASLVWPGHSRAADDPAARGRYLATIGGCADCHSTKAGAFAGGREFHSGFGVVESANISSDVQTGIGSWNADQFYQALHKGRSKGGMHLYPAFPYPYFTHITRADSDALFAYIRTAPPVSNSPHRNRLSFPMNIRGIMAIWNLLFFRPGEFQPDPAQSAAWNRGAYIVTGLAHCGACHTPKNFLQADKRSHPFEGGVIEGWFAPDLTGDPRTGLGGWSEDDVFAFLKTGRNPHTAAGGLMANVVQNSISKLDDEDVRAIAVYLKSLPAPPPEPAHSVDPAAMTRGAAVYTAKCAVCHGPDGAGVSERPPLRGSPNVQARNPATLIKYVLGGNRTAATAAYPRVSAMPAMASQLDDAQIADVITYVRNAWGDAAPPVKPRQVARIRAASAPPPTEG